MFALRLPLGCRAHIEDPQTMPDRPVYQRVLLKLSGEALMGKREDGLDNDTVRAIATDIRDVIAIGVQLAP